MKLYHTPHAVNPERVSMFLKVKNKLDAVEIVPVGIMKGEHKTPEYQAISPYSQVPALQLDNGTVITESRAICEYFESLFPEPNLLGMTPEERGLITMWDRRVEFLWMMSIAGWFRNGSPIMAPLENPQIPEQAEKSEKAARKFAKGLAAHFEKEEFLAAGRFSIADITAYATTGFARVVGWQAYEEYASLGDWYKRVADILENGLS